MKIKKLPDTMYETIIYVVLTDDWEKVNKRFNTNIKKTHGAVTFEFEEPSHRVYMAFNKNHFQLKYLVHECVHVVNWTFQYAGVKIDYNNDEPQAYFTGWLFNEAYKFLVKELLEPLN